MFVLLNQYTCFYRGILRLTATKLSSLIFVNITEIVWVFTGEARAKTAKYHLEWLCLGTRAQRKLSAAW